MFSDIVPDQISLTFIATDETNENSNRMNGTSANVVGFDELMRQWEFLIRENSCAGDIWNKWNWWFIKNVFFSYFIEQFESFWLSKSYWKDAKKIEKKITVYLFLNYLNFNEH